MADYLGDASKFLQCNGYRFTLKCDCVLGKRGDTIMSPIDSSILPVIYNQGGWQPEELQFMAHRIDENESYLMLDIGANIGLFTRQMLKAFPYIERAICIEPAPGNFQCLQFNLNNIGTMDVKLFNFALGPIDSTMTFYQEISNMGNYSLNAAAMRGAPSQVIAVPVASASRWMSENVTVRDSVIWKSDTQGYDEIIIVETPWRIWRRVKLAIIELWRIEKPDFDRAAFLEKISDFKYMSIGINNVVRPEEVMNFIDSIDGHYEDLYLWR